MKDTQAATSVADNGADSADVQGYFTNLLEMPDGQIPSAPLFNISLLDT